MIEKAKQLLIPNTTERVLYNHDKTKLGLRDAPMGIAVCMIVVYIFESIFFISTAIYFSFNELDTKEKMNVFVEKVYIGNINKTTEEINKTIKEIEEDPQKCKCSSCPEYCYYNSESKIKKDREKLTDMEKVFNEHQNIAVFINSYLKRNNKVEFECRDITWLKIDMICYMINVIISILMGLLIAFWWICFHKKRWFYFISLLSLLINPLISFYWFYKRNNEVLFIDLFKISGLLKCVINILLQLIFIFIVVRCKLIIPYKITLVGMLKMCH